MNVFFEDSGKLQAARLFSEADASVQIESESGKRSKIKLANVLLRFAQPEPRAMLEAASALAQTLELEFLWEVAGDEEFAADELALDFFSAKPSETERIALMQRLHGAPHYFARKGKGRFKRAPVEQVKAALLGIERKRLETERIESLCAALLAGQLPETVQQQLYKLLFKPDKNAGEYKALVLACQRSGKGVLPLLMEVGAITDAHQFHMQRFLFEWFPNGTAFPALAPPVFDASKLALAPVQAFSIDDSATTEIDDAFSLQDAGDAYELGIHIAAPALAIKPQDAIDKLAAQRMSTVYMPGEKLTMLPDALVQGFTLAEGRACAAVSIYLRVDKASFSVLSTRSVIERIYVAANLRHDVLDSSVTEDALRADAAAQSYPFAAELKVLFALAERLKLGREQVRGKPERFTRPDFNFAVAQGKVTITERRRGAPLDLIVSELMIFANCAWGKLLADVRVPGMYRSQHGFGAMQRTRMGTEPRPHIGLGVAQYIWATSPLRRYSDLVNQWQLLAAIEHGATAGLVAPFKPKDAQLFSIVSRFEEAYKGYASNQSTMERLWTLRYVQQQGVTEFEAEVLREGAMRALKLPLVVQALAAQSLTRGTRVRLGVSAIDEISLEMQVRILEVYADQAQEPQAEEEEEAPLTTGVQLAIDTTEPSAAAEPDANP